MSLVLCLALALVGCQKQAVPVPTGSARFAIAVQQAVTEADVQRVDVTLDAEDILETTVPLVKDGTVWTGLMRDIRAGTDRRFRAFAYDAQDRLIFRGEATEVIITAHETVQVNILAQQVEPPPVFSNEAPFITSLVVSRSSVEPGGFVDVQATAVDPNPGDVITYAWSASCGTFDDASSPQARWTAPVQAGTCVLTVTVSDPAGASTSISFPIEVQGLGVGDAEIFVRFNAWPEVVSLTGAPTHVRPGDAVSVSARVVDNDGSPGSLSYTWTATCAGTWTDANTASARFTPSETPANPTCDNCELQVRVSDGRGGEGSGRLAICVGAPVGPRFPPQLVSAYQSSRTASPGGTVIFRVHAYDPEGGSLGFAWEANTGTLGSATDAGGTSTLVWTAPACIDARVTPAVKVHITDATGLELLQSFDLTWTGPACPTALAFSTPPSDALATAPLSPAVQVSLLDSLGREVSSASGTVTLALGNNPGNGTLSGTTQGAVSQGRATFADLSIDVPGAGYTLVASAEGLPSVTSTPFTILPLNVLGSRVDRLLGTGNASASRATDLSTTTIAALVEQQGGGFITLPGVGRADGTFSIAGVPPGPYYLRIGTDYLVTSSRSPDLGVDAQGRSDAVTPGTATYLAVDLQGLETWQATDDLEVFSPGVGLWSQGVQALHQAGTRPAPGDARWTQTLRYRSFFGSRLVEAARGDSLTFHQLSTRVPGGADEGEGLTYAAASRAFTTNALSMLDGVTTSLSGTMVTLPQDRALGLDWRFSAFEALRASVSPSAQVASHALFVGAFPSDSRGSYTAVPDLMTFFPPVGGRDRVFSFSYGSPYPGFAEVGHVDTTFTVAYALPRSGGGMAAPVSIYPSVTVTEPLPGFAAGQLQPRLSPARAPTIEGQDAFGTRTGVGLTPRLAWSAPEVGQPSHYQVRIFELYVDGAGNTRQGKLAGQLYTAGTHVTVPPGVLEAGKSYFALLVAFSRGNADFQARPFRTSWPEAEATLATGVFSP